MKKVILINFFIFSFCLFSCDHKNKSEKDETKEPCVSVIGLGEHIPGPLEMAMLLKRAGIDEIEPMVFDSIDLTDKNRLPIFFGKLITNLSFSIYYTMENDELIFHKLMAISEELDIDSAFSEKEWSRFNRTQNKDTLMEILVDNIIMVNERMETSENCEKFDLIFIGSLIESYYYYVQAFRKNPENMELFQRLLDARLTIGMIDDFFDQNKPENALLLKISKRIKSLRKQYKDLLDKNHLEEQMLNEGMADHLFKGIEDLRNEMLNIKTIGQEVYR